MKNGRIKVHSKMTSSANFCSGAHIIPDSNKGATAFTRACLSFPLLGLKFTTGISIFRSSYVSGKPLAFASTMTVSGFQ